MSTITVFQQMLIILILISIGYILYKKGVIKDEESRAISFIVINITNPCFVISSGFSDDGFNITHDELLTGLAVALIIYFVLIAFGTLLPYIIRVKKEDCRFYEVMSVYTNVGFIGLPVVKAVLGQEAAVYAMIFTIIYTLLFYTHGYIRMLGGAQGADEKISPKNFINVGTIAAAVTIVLVWFNIQLPMIVEDTIEYTGRSTTFLAMLVLGVSFARLPIKKLIGNVKIYLMVVIRFLAFPIATALLLKHFFGNAYIAEAAALITAMPAGNTPLMLAEKNGIPTDTLSSGILITTVLSVVTVTLTAMVM